MATTRQNPIRLTNKKFSEWQVDQALAFAKESIDSRFCPGYAMKNPTLVGILMKMQMEIENRLDTQDLNPKLEETPTEDEQLKSLNKKSMLEMTKSILQSNFPNRQFTASQAFDAIRPIRSSISKFRSEKSFRGTILRELQTLRNKGILIFVDNDGVYCFR